MISSQHPCNIVFSAWLKDTVHPIIGQMDRRITRLTGLNVRSPYGEYLQVVNYGIGGHYEPHFDHATVSSWGRIQGGGGGRRGK